MKPEIQSIIETTVTVGMIAYTSFKSFKKTEAKVESAKSDVNFQSNSNADSIVAELASIKDDIRGLKENGVISSVALQALNSTVNRLERSDENRSAQSEKTAKLVLELGRRFQLSEKTIIPRDKK